MVALEVNGEEVHKDQLKGFTLITLSDNKYVFKNGKEVGKRLVCQYPQVAMYKGSGNTEDPASFMCK